VREGLWSLSKQHRDVIRLFAIEQHSHSEITTIMGGPVATAKTRLFRARENLSRIVDGTR
jgi:DNA-directed RNA polymerase specialized sigma24 family protein